MKLQVLLVEDDAGDLKRFEQALPPVFQENQVEVTLHLVGTLPMRSSSPPIPYVVMI